MLLPLDACPIFCEISGCTWVHSYLCVYVGIGIIDIHIYIIIYVVHISVHRGNGSIYSCFHLLYTGGCPLGKYAPILVVHEHAFPHNVE